jgi:diaminopimelate epimerase
VTAAGWKTGQSDRKVTVELLGGELQIEINEAGHAIMTGPAETVFQGDWLLTLPALK